MTETGYVECDSLVSNVIQYEAQRTQCALKFDMPARRAYISILDLRDQAPEEGQVIATLVHVRSLKPEAVTGRYDIVTGDS